MNNQTQNPLHPSRKVVRAWASRFMGLLALAALGQGCIVQTSTTGMGTLEVQWDTASCGPAGAATIEVQAVQGSFVAATKGGISCNKGSTTLVLDPGVYTINIRGFSNGGQAVTAVAVDDVLISANLESATPPISLTGGNIGGGGGGGGGKQGTVEISWTVGGKAAAAGCKAHGVDKVVISVLDETKKTVLASGTAACGEGGANLVKVPEGRVMVQLDGVAPDGAVTFGNDPLLGPLDVQAGLEIVVQNPIDLRDLRGTVSLDWAFADGGTCGSHNTQTVYLELSDLSTGAKVVVPWNDPWTKKACDLGPSSSYAARVVDMQFADPTCSIPPDAKGLVICGVRTGSLGVRAFAVDKVTGNPTYGGTMTIKPVEMGKHTLVANPLLLSPCDSVPGACNTP